MGVKTFKKADTPCKKSYKGSQEVARQWKSEPLRRRTHHPIKGCKGRVKTLEKAEKGVNKGYNASQDP